MLEYRVLVVDNDGDLLIAAREQLSELDGVVPVCAQSVEDAMTLIRSDYFHLAVIDLKLHENFDSGMEVLQSLREASPSCTRIAMTRLAREDPYGVMRALSPYDPVVDGIINKQARSYRSREFAELVRPRVEELRHRAVEFDGLESVIEAVLKNKGRLVAGARTTPAIETELRTLLQRLFGGRVPQPKGEEAVLEVRLVNQGLSGAVAFSVVPIVSRDPVRHGSYCFVKVASRPAIDQEATRFRDRVQMNVPLKFRVDLLGFELGDGLGAIAYSFAGGGVSAVRSLDGVAHADGIASDAVVSTIEKLFESNESSWYTLLGPEAPIGAYFEHELRSNFIERLQILRNACKKIASNFGGRLDTDSSTLTFGVTTVALPGDSLYGKGYLARKRPTTLIHGDMHGGNILLSENSDIYLIDFAHAGFGPPAVDAAVLHGTIRLWDATALEGHTDLATVLDSVIQKEERLAMEWRGGPPMPPRDSGWERPAQALDRGVRENFDFITADDVLWVYLLHAARLSTLHVGQLGRLRVLAWFTGIKRALDQPAA